MNRAKPFRGGDDVLLPWGSNVEPVPDSQVEFDLSACPYSEGLGPSHELLPITWYRLDLIAKRGPPGTVIQALLLF